MTKLEKEAQDFLRNYIFFNNIPDISRYKKKKFHLHNQELEEEMKMGYEDLVFYLIDKYGIATADYFTNPDCVQFNTQIDRTAEGLFCHHIWEIAAPILSNGIYAKRFPWAWQQANALCYATTIEHFILHIKILEDSVFLKSMAPNGCVIQPGMGGISFLSGVLKIYFSSNGSKTKWQQTCAEKTLAICDKHDFLILQKYAKNLYNHIFKEKL